MDVPLYGITAIARVVDSMQRLVQKYQDILHSSRSMLCVIFPVAPTVMALPRLEIVAGILLLFPAATTTWTPASTALSTAWWGFKPLPLMLMTAPFGRGCLVTQSIAATIPADPRPLELKTLTAIKLAFLAIPSLPQQFIEWNNKHKREQGEMSES
jgi:hypothetical protein